MTDACCGFGGLDVESTSANQVDRRLHCHLKDIRMRAIHKNFQFKLLIVILSSCGQAAASDVPPVALESADMAYLRTSETVKTGFLFVNDVYVRPPYVVEFTTHGIQVNGFQCSQPSTADKPSREGRKRPKGNRGFGDFDVGRSSGRRAGEFSDTLRQGGVVVVRDDFPAVYVHHGGDMYDFCAAMLAADPTIDQINEFIRLPAEDSQREIWRSWLLSYKAPPDLRIQLQSIFDEIASVTAQGKTRTAAIERLEAFTYPLTILGMLVGVFALGHILKWTARSIVAEKNADYSPEVIRCVEIALLLMLGMSSIDLFWTILGSQAGVMREVNPIAAGMIQSPYQLIVFKIGATCVGCGILYAWRQRTQIQNATWWMCLVCVLLTFRWVVFSSVMS